MIAELVGFIKGYTNANDFMNLGTKIWNANAADPKWLENKNRSEPGDLGRIYGAQWRGFRSVEAVNHPQDSMLYESRIRETDQLQDLVNGLIANPQGRRHIVSAWNPGELDQMALPPCFVAGTLVATPEGYLPIEKIVTGASVISATGRVETVEKVWETPHRGDFVDLEVRYQNQPITSTSNHPFLVKGKGWVEAGQIEEGDMMGIPRDQGDTYHRFQYLSAHNQYAMNYTVETLTDDDYWMLGYFVGDGWVSQTTPRVSFAIAKKDEEEVLPRIRQCIKVSRKPGDSPNVSTFESMSTKYAPLLREFGYRAKGKQIPAWVLSSPVAAIESFLAGYAKADGHNKPAGGIQLTTVSDSLAYGLQRLYAKLGVAASVQYQRRPATCVIEGRTVQQQGTYSVNVPKLRNHFCEVDKDYLWVPVKSVFHYYAERCVYNLQVSNEHTYTANNLATHNCHILFQCYVSNEGYLDLQMYQRSCDVFLGLPFNIASYAALLSYLSGVCGYEPRNLHMTLGDTHLYENQYAKALVLLDREPLDLPRLEITVVRGQDVDEVEVEDFFLFDYKSHPAIHVPMVV